jgi:hypothetical protein
MHKNKCFHIHIISPFEHYVRIVSLSFYKNGSYEVHIHNYIDLSHLPLALHDRGRRGFRLSPGRSPKDSIPSGPPASNVAIGNLLQNVSFNGKIIYEWKIVHYCVCLMSGE